MWIVWSNMRGNIWEMENIYLASKTVRSSRINKVNGRFILVLLDPWRDFAEESEEIGVPKVLTPR